MAEVAEASVTERDERSLTLPNMAKGNVTYAS